MDDSREETGIEPLIAFLRADDPLFDAYMRLQEQGRDAISTEELSALYREGLIKAEAVTI